MMNALGILTIVASVLTIILFAANIIQFKEHRSLLKRLRSFAQGTFMDHYMIARSCARLRDRNNEETNEKEQINLFWKEMQYINGIADSARNNIISVSEEQLDFTPEFRHPAFPEKRNFEAEIKLGKTPEEAVLKKDGNSHNF